MAKTNKAPKALLVPTCRGCGYQAIPDGEPDPVFCPKCDCDEWRNAEECSCPPHVVDPSAMCARHQAEYVAYLDEQAALDNIQQQYEAQEVRK